MEIINGILITLIFIVFIAMIVESLTYKIQEELNSKIEANETLIKILEKEHLKSDTLLKIIYHIRRELSLINLKDCPEEEKINIPNEIIGWINELEMEIDGDDNGLYK